MRGGEVMAERVLELPICWKYVLPKEGGGGVMKGEKSVQKLYLFHLFSLFYTSQQGQKF